jgi:hypothetical protein
MSGYFHYLYSDQNSVVKARILIEELIQCLEIKGNIDDYFEFFLCPDLNWLENHQQLTRARKKFELTCDDIVLSEENIAKFLQVKGVEKKKLYKEDVILVPINKLKEIVSLGLIKPRTDSSDYLYWELNIWAKKKNKLIINLAERISEIFIHKG